MHGRERRIRGITANDGKTLIVAFDHGQTGANVDGMAFPGKTLDDVIGAGADAILTTVGIAEEFATKLRRVGLVVNMDLSAGHEEAAVREALILGADMGKFILTPWNPDVPNSVAEGRHLAAACHAWGLPLMVEPIPVSFAATEAHTPERIGQAARIACEIGADVVKMQYPGESAVCRDIVARVYRPVVILGGPKRADDRGVLQDIRNAMDAGAIGIAIGRNIWAHDRPARMVAALAAIIHGDATVEAAMRELTKTVA